MDNRIKQIVSTADQELLREHARLSVVYEGLEPLIEKIGPKITEQQAQLFYGFLLILEDHFRDLQRHKRNLTPVPLNRGMPVKRHTIKKPIISLEHHNECIR